MQLVVLAGLHVLRSCVSSCVSRRYVVQSCDSATACFVTTWLHGGFSQCTVELLQMALSGYHSTIVHRIEYTCISKR